MALVAVKFLYTGATQSFHYQYYRRRH